jgi:hypothetical protein
VALFGHGAISKLSLLSGTQRKSPSGQLCPLPELMLPTSHFHASCPLARPQAKSTALGEFHSPAGAISMQEFEGWASAMTTPALAATSRQCAAGATVQQIETPRFPSSEIGNTRFGCINTIAPAANARSPCSAVAARTFLHDTFLPPVCRITPTLS